MSCELWAIDGQGGQAVVRERTKWYLVSIDRGWNPTELDDENDAFVWASRTKAISSDLKYASMQDAVADIRRICLTQLEAPPTTFDEVRHLCPDEELISDDQESRISQRVGRVQARRTTTQDQRPDRWPVPALVERCLSRPPDETAWIEFVRRYHAGIRASVGKAFRLKAREETERRGQFPEDLIEDLVQAVYVRLVEEGQRALTTFEGKTPDSIYQYLGILSVSVVQDYFREIRTKKRPKVTYSLEELLEHTSDDPILDAAAGRLDGLPVSEIHAAQDVERALSRAVSGSKQRNRNILLFKFRYYDGLPLDSIINVMRLNISRHEANSILNRITVRVREILSP